MIAEPFVFCLVCGAFSAKRLEALQEHCKGGLLYSSARTVLKRLGEGKHPADGKTSIGQRRRLTRKGWQRFAAAGLGRLFLEDELAAENPQLNEFTPRGTCFYENSLGAPGVAEVDGGRAVGVWFPESHVGESEPA